MLSPAIRLEQNIPDFNFCVVICAGRKMTVSENSFVYETIILFLKYRALFVTQLALLFCYGLFGGTTKRHEISTKRDINAGTQNATYATWSHLDHSCAYVVNMVLQKEKINIVNIVLNVNVFRKSFLLKKCQKLTH